MKYIGLDCHKQYDFATSIDSETGEVKSKKLTHNKEEFRAFIGDRSKGNGSWPCSVIADISSWWHREELVKEDTGDLKPPKIPRKIYFVKYI